MHEPQGLGHAGCPVSACGCMFCTHAAPAGTTSQAEVDDLEGSAGMLEEGAVYSLPVLPLDGEFMWGPSR